MVCLLVRYAKMNVRVFWINEYDEKYLKLSSLFNHLFYDWENEGLCAVKYLVV
jgi:uncharacterized Zn finger protein